MSQEGTGSAPSPGAPRWRAWRPGERCSLAVTSEAGGYLAQDGRRHFRFGRVLLVSEAVDPYLGPNIVVGLDGTGEVAWREAIYVHAEWHYWDEADFFRSAAEAHRRMIWGELEEEEEGGGTGNGGAAPGPTPPDG